MSPAEMAAIHAASFTAPRPWTATEFGTTLATPGVFLITETSGFLIGRVILDEAEVLTLAVDPARRREGTGGALVTRFLAESVGLGATTAFLEVRADNDAARRLYQRAGFRDSGLRRGYYHLENGSVVDAVVMSRSLPIKN